MNQNILHAIDKAANVIGNTWPLHTFVASNPLSGYENNSFEDAVGLAEKHLVANALPSPEMYQQAWLTGDIDKTVLISLLKKEGFTNSPELYLEQLYLEKKTQIENPNHKLDLIMSKWLAAFMDEGLAEWDMPFKSEGFYSAWRMLVIYDSEVGATALNEIPKSSQETLEAILREYSENERHNIFTYHLAALPGWTGYIKHRNNENSDWQSEYPISLMDYLGARLWTAKKLGISIQPPAEVYVKTDSISKLKYIWLKAWEQSWQNQLVDTLESELDINKAISEVKIPDAQLVFCIDTRSELIRRHVESKGNYETFGYAGFFGIAMDYQNLTDGIIRKSCPPILHSAYKVSEQAQLNHSEKLTKYKKRNKTLKFRKYFLRRMKNMLPSAFGYVEGTGVFYGFSLLLRTLMPQSLYHFNEKTRPNTETFCEPGIEKFTNEAQIPEDISLSEKVAIVKSAFDLMGWKNFAPLVVFVGHGSHSANNPFSSSLDCGACAASPGRHNARMLAKLANLKSVRKELFENYNINIPNDTIFIGAEHNTTTDDIVLFDSVIAPKHKEQLSILKSNLLEAQKTATIERLGKSNRSVSKSYKKANNWSETRPEWGLAKNAGFIIGPRELTKNANLDSRCFLHSYNWELDVSGKALEGIMQGPMTVTQWINNHYYFSTVDNSIFGGGSKITHNITGKFSVVQGNGGDLKMGLPLQSLFESDDAMYHQPLRLSVMIQAPIYRVSEIIARNEGLKTLVDNEWVYLLVMDPEHKNEIFRYGKSLKWKSVSSKTLTTNILNKPVENLIHS